MPPSSPAAALLGELDALHRDIVFPGTFDRLQWGTIAKNTYSGLETVVFCGFTPQEQGEIHDLAASLA